MGEIHHIINVRLCYIRKRPARIGYLSSGPYVMIRHEVAIGPPHDPNIRPMFLLEYAYKNNPDWKCYIMTDTELYWRHVIHGRQSLEVDVWYDPEPEDKTMVLEAIRGFSEGLDSHN